MNETNVAKSTSLIFFGGEMVGMFWDLRWMVALSIVLVVVDFWFGIKASLHRSDKIRKSRAGRRTMSKIIDYMCYLALGGILGQAIGEPLGIPRDVVAAVCIGIACLFEMDSIIHNVCECHDVKVSFSLRRLIIFFIKRKNKDMGDALEDSINEKTDEDENK